jgi:hypothetical protein
MFYYLHNMHQISQAPLIDIIRLSLRRRRRTNTRLFLLVLTVDNILMKLTIASNWSSKKTGFTNCLVCIERFEF